jgi:hypothetical protein
LPEALLHRGRVLRDGDRPVAGALIAVASGTAPTPEIAIRSDQHGQFRIALPRGRFIIEARAPDGAAGNVQVVVEATAIEFKIVLER